ncbi:expansin (peptidoglycan-binding protein) [Kitasatospora sp. MAP12-15]|uniref:expansin EXLX1 family cellulose-binding protein n=1 Tax=unclassified Kitasatospora TaxID=2633591 RepID=UPI0024759BAB|nr:expansin EXLX1 family cellulose-binding protein [Kitasatospora sp. MAP12-44]MDH6115379.1 expansin (peptidoglycan-binding protein) [Kitasatospora sp. MAP12-44]
MKATKHAAQRPWHRHGPARGVPLALLVVGVLVCLVVTFLVGGGGEPGHPAALAAAGTAAPGASVPPTAEAAPSASSASASADASPSVASSAPASVTASPAPSAAPTRTPVPAASAAPTAAASGSAGAAPAAATLAGRIKPGVTNQGVATAYAAADGNGSCLYGPSDDMMIAAMNYTDYESSKACGAYVSVRTASGAAITVRIVNDCPAPCAPGQLDLSQQAFAKLADLSVGRLPITWTLLSPDSVGTVSIRYKTGSSKWWCGIQVIGHRNPLAELEVRGAGGWQQLPRSDFNYFLSTDGTGCGGELRLTDIYGQQLTLDGITVQPDVVQPTGVQFARH